MPKLILTFKTSVTPQQFIAALTDFSPNRGAMWANSTSDYLIVHAKDQIFADVTEGSRVFGGVWERLHYDWSNPSKVILKTVDSNVWSNKSSWTYDMIPTPDGNSTIIKCTVERFPISNKGRFLIAFVSIYGRRLLRKDLDKLLKNIESR